jgi:hypothetical protein
MRFYRFAATSAVLGTMLTVCATTVPAHATTYDSKFFDFKTTDNGAEIIGGIVFPVSGCGYTKIKDPNEPGDKYENEVTDNAADGHGAIAYIGYVPCGSRTGTIMEKTLASVAGEGQRVALPTTTYYNVEWAAVRVCEYNGKNQVIDCSGWGN